MPNRILREGILTSEVINRLTGGAELFYRRLLSVVDDYGRYHAHADLLRAALYPLRLDKVSSDNIKSWLAECAKEGVISVYEHEGRSYLHVAKFQNGQRLRAKSSKFPSPDGHMTVIRQPIALSHDGHAHAYSDAETESSSETYSEPKAETYSGGSAYAAPRNGVAKPSVSIPTCVSCQKPAIKRTGGISYCSDHLPQA